MITPFMIPPRPDNPLYMFGLTLSNLDITAFLVNPGTCNDFSGNVDLTLKNPITVDLTKVGVNAVDRPLAIDTMYGVYIIGDALGYHPTGVLLSPLATTSGLSNTLIRLPDGYINYRLRAYIFNTVSGIQPFIMTGNSESFQMFYMDSISVLTGGTSSSFAPISLYGVVPVGNTMTIFNCSTTAGATGESVFFRQMGSTATFSPGIDLFTLSAPPITGSPNSRSISFMANYNAISNRFGIEYQSHSGASLQLSVTGYHAVV